MQYVPSYIVFRRVTNQFQELNEVQMNTNEAIGLIARSYNTEYHSREKMYQIHAYKYYCKNTRYTLRTVFISSLQENVAVVEFHTSARIVQSLTTDYSHCRRAIGEWYLWPNAIKWSLNVSIHNIIYPCGPKYELHVPNSIHCKTESYCERSDCLVGLQ